MLSRKKIQQFMDQQFYIAIVVIPLALFLIGYGVTSLILKGDTDSIGDTHSNSEVSATTETTEPEVIVTPQEVRLGTTEQFILQIASFNSKEGAEAAVIQFQKEDLRSHWIKSGQNYKVYVVMSSDQEIIGDYRTAFIKDNPEHSDAYVSNVSLELKNFTVFATPEEVQEIKTFINDFYFDNNAFFMQFMDLDTVPNQVLLEALEPIQKTLEILDDYSGNIDTEFTSMLQENYAVFEKLNAENASSEAYMDAFIDQLMMLTSH
ncbi:SPOR domain-containing protein [Fusibacter tunisiensis]|uniref:SPOR domain-containing protein n=1 Tax=Fusibacter tunisiensis TaxID=1008308 RepID=A0ABS2MN01_9FIRM|nr:SPOR domain-containing protein [Fusibacter tunisiensis]MBM7560771.1 hypothetical protein [Fusibacter tunisiensis]